MFQMFWDVLGVIDSQRKTTQWKLQIKVSHNA